MMWNRERLETWVRQRLHEAKLIVVANREPYIHQYVDDRLEWYQPASGLTTALDPVLRACGGTWVAHGSGNADRDVVDPFDRIAVPPDQPSYTLRRVWLTKEQEQGYYYGFANDTLWPLCHNAHVRPKFDSHDWAIYRQVNQHFANVVLEEIGDDPALVFVQDYHFAMLPRMLKSARPDLTIAHFWHIPWPSFESFRICPWHAELLDGLLGNDLLAFHTRYDCNNFLETVDRTLEAKIDLEFHAVTRGGQRTLVRAHPISVDPEHADALAVDWKFEERRLRRRYRLGKCKLLVGVDRVDYIKGIPERFRAVDRLLTLHPSLRGQFCLLQVGAPSRVHLSTYRSLGDDLERLADEINWKYGDEEWKPIVFLHEHVDSAGVHRLYRLATGCVVSSLHDGMNLVAKEFVATRSDLRGSLVLSEFTGAARELTDALIVNPYDLDAMANAMFRCLTMSEAEQEARMFRMRQRVLAHNIFRWAGKLLADAVQVQEEQRTPWPNDNHSDSGVWPALPSYALGGSR